MPTSAFIAGQYSDGRPSKGELLRPVCLLVQSAAKKGRLTSRLEILRNSRPSRFHDAVSGSRGCDLSPRLSIFRDVALTNSFTRRDFVSERTARLVTSRSCGSDNGLIVMPSREIRQAALRGRNANAWCSKISSDTSSGLITWKMSFGRTFLPEPTNRIMSYR
jgi:hypothetical protein